MEAENTGQIIESFSSVMKSVRFVNHIFYCENVTREMKEVLTGEQDPE